MMEASAALVSDLDALATRFEEAVQPGTVPSTSGWGQFLDTTRTNTQVGPYGTAAGVLVLSLANRGDSRPVRAAVSLLRHWWDTRSVDSYAAERLAQVPRLAFLNLALGYCSTSEAQTLRAEISGELIAALLPAKMWGAYWVDANMHDATPRVLPSSLVALSFCLPPSVQGQTDLRESPKVLQVLEELRKRIAATNDLTGLEEAITIAALLHSPSKDCRDTAARRVRRIVRTRPVVLTDRAPYFFDYESPIIPGPGRHSGHDFIIAPPEPVLAIASCSKESPGLLRLRGDAVLSALSDNIRQHDGTFKGGNSDRISTIDQAWCALALHHGSDTHLSVPSHTRLLYKMLRQRRGNLFTETIIPVLSLLLTSVFTAATKEGPLWANTYAIVATLIVGGIYGPRYIAKLFPGRS